MVYHDDGYGTLRLTEAHHLFARRRDLLIDLRSDLDAARKAFTWTRPGLFNWALEWFDVIAADNPRPALELLHADGRSRTVTYQQLSTRSDRIANWLVRLGVQREDRLMVVLGQQSELWETILACLKIGAVVIPTYTSLTRAEAADRVTRGQVRHLVARSDTAPLFEGLELATRIAVGEPVAGWTDYRDSAEAPDRYIPVRATPTTQPAFAYFTSGTTSTPKLVTHTHASYPIGHLSSMYFNGLVPGDRHMNISAPGWAKHSWSSLFVPFTAEATLVVLPDEGVEPGRLPQLLEQHAVTSLCAPPSRWTQLAQHLDAGSPALREATSAGEPLPAQVADAVEAAWQVPVRDGYGQTETTALIGTTPGMVRRPGWLGKPLPGWDIRIHDGQVCVDLANDPVGLMAGYDGDQARTRKAIADGLYRTGDIGEVGPDGYIRILGRSDDVFKSGGHRISPYELEAVLRTHPAVRDAAVVPAAHPALGLAAHAVVELADGCTAEAADLLAHVDAQVTEALRVHTVAFTDQLPRTASGKVRRSAVTPAPTAPVLPVHSKEELSHVS
jgi:acetyl-CoA synthetase